MVRKKCQRRTRKHKDKRKRTLRMRGGAKRFLMIIRGEAFRLGKSGEGRNGVDDSYAEQEEACKTQMNLVKKIESQGYKVDILLNTYHTKFDDKLKGFYGSNLKEAHFHKEKFANQPMQLRNTVEMYEKLNTHYDVILITRPDLWLKQKLIDDYDPSVKTLQFLSLVWVNGNIYHAPNKHTLVHDIFTHIPIKYFHKFKEFVYHPTAFENHSNLHMFLEYVPMKYKTEYTVLSKVFFDGNTTNEYNPYYKLAGRNEVTTMYEKDRDIRQLPEFKDVV